MNFMQILRDVTLFNISANTSKISKGITSIENLIQEFGIEFNQRIEQLREDLNKHLTNITTELAIQSRIFENINTVLSNKRKTEAEELKTSGIKALRNRWIDDAFTEVILYE